MRQQATMHRRLRVSSRRRGGPGTRAKPDATLRSSEAPSLRSTRRPELPRCCTCGKVLMRVPACLVSSATSRGFQCEDCFYPGTERRPPRSGMVSSERTRWWAELVEGGDPTE